MNLIFVGDVVGKPGRLALKRLLPGLSGEYGADLVIANGENAAAGFGINEKVATEIFQAGVDVITTGNHVWDKKEALSYLAGESRVIRPANYPPGVPGFGSILYTARDGRKVGVLNLSGRVFMPSLACPFTIARNEVERLCNVTNRIIIDFHAEATSEKIAFGYYLDGKVSAVLGTHTHVQTADEKILPGGTAYITDIGMTGPSDSVIGMQKEQIIERFLYALPQKFEVAKGPTVFSAVVVRIDDVSGKALSIKRLMQYID